MTIHTARDFDMYGDLLEYGSAAEAQQAANRAKRDGWEVIGVGHYRAYGRVFYGIALKDPKGLPFTIRSEHDYKAVMERRAQA